MAIWQRYCQATCVSSTDEGFWGHLLAYDLLSLGHHVSESPYLLNYHWPGPIAKNRGKESFVVLQ